MPLHLNSAILDFVSTNLVVLAISAAAVAFLVSCWLCRNESLSSVGVIESSCKLFFGALFGFIGAQLAFIDFSRKQLTQPETLQVVWQGFLICGLLAICVQTGWHAGKLLVAKKT